MKQTLPFLQLRVSEINAYSLFYSWVCFTIGDSANPSECSLSIIEENLPFYRAGG